VGEAAPHAQLVLIITTTTTKETIMERPLHTVFVYGTLKRGGGLHHYLARAKYLGEGSLRNHEMFDLGWFPGVKPGDGQVHGELYDVDAVTLANLDAVESEGSLYLRRSLWVDVAPDLATRAYAYIYKHSVEDDAKVESGVWEVAL
jgi:gamma-glutamylcyclotransferase (GGCT)/AIG2-like uncharacterized protein YtfP